MPGEDVPPSSALVLTGGFAARGVLWPPRLLTPPAAATSELSAMAAGMLSPELTGIHSISIHVQICIYLSTY
jgi:hypothetical protein